MSSPPQHSLLDPDFIPQTADQVWAGFEELDQATPLETEILKTWQIQGIQIELVRFTVCVYRGETLKLAGYYAHPKEGTPPWPGLVLCNGGGQKAHSGGPLQWALNGYACFNPNNGAQAWDNPCVGLPNTDWGTFNPGITKPDVRTGKGPLAPGPGTVDNVESPRNYQWYLRMVGMRRALTFFLSLPEVDSDKLGIRGHSTGGVMTVHTAIDKRCKACVPSVGGCGHWWDEDYGEFVVNNKRVEAGMNKAQQKLYLDSMSCEAHWKLIQCPVLFLGASNDFNSPTENVVRALEDVPHDNKRLVLPAHYNHAFSPPAAIADVLWFETHLKGSFQHFPATPCAHFVLKMGDGIPVLRVQPDPECPWPIRSVDIYYSYERQPQVRFWADAGAKQIGDWWHGKCPIFYEDEALFGFANVTYDIEHHLQAPQVKNTQRLLVTSNYCAATPAQLKDKGVKPTETPQRLIDDFSRGLHDWTGSLKKGNNGWKIETRKLADPRWVGPKGASLVVEVNASKAHSWLGVQVQRRFRGQNTGEWLYFCYVELLEQGWNTVQLLPDQFENCFGKKLDDWHKIIGLAFHDAQSLAKTHQKKATQTGGTGAPSLPTDTSAWDSSYYQSTDASYAESKVEGAISSSDNTEVSRHFRNLRWEGGEYISRPKHHEKG